MIKCKKCHSYALNIAPESGLCDVCYYRVQAESVPIEAICTALNCMNVEIEECLESGSIKAIDRASRLIRCKAKINKWLAELANKFQDKTKIRRATMDKQQ